jgi:hypothetical protein
MRNIVLLIRKDLITALINPSNLWVMLLLFVCLVAFNPVLVFVLVIYLMVVNLFAQEENDLVCNVTGILPIRMEQAVLARYVYAWLLLAVTTILSGLASFAWNIFIATSGGGDYWLQSLFFALATALLMMSVIMPLNYKLGVMRAKIASMIIYILMVVVATVFSAMSNIDANSVYIPARTPSVTLISVIAVLVTAPLSVLSLLISLKIKKR